MSKLVGAVKQYLATRFGKSHKARRNAIKEYRQLQHLLVADTGTMAYVSMRVSYTQQRLTELEGMLQSGDLNPKDFACLPTKPLIALSDPSAT